MIAQNVDKIVKMDHFFVPEDVQSSETDSSPFFRFLQYLVFEIWSILYSKFLVNWGL